MAELNLQGLRDELVQSFTQFKGAAQKDIEDLKAALQGIESHDALKNLKTQVDQLRAELQAPARTAPGAAEEKTAGQLFTESAEFKAFQGRGWHRGGAGMKLNAKLLESKTTITSAAVGSSTPGILTPERVEGIIKPPIRRLRVRSLIPWAPTTSNAVDFVKENVFTNNASPQTEASDKAETALTFVIGSAPVRTIAHWIPATRQVLDDLGQLQGYIDNRLIDGLDDVEDYELLSGDGSGVHVSGLLTLATAYAGDYAAAGDTKIDVLNNAAAELEDDEFVPDGIVVNPADWRKIMKIKTEEGGANKGMYVMGGPAQSPGFVVWDLPVVRTTAMPKGKFLMGQFRGSAQGFLRMEATVDISTEHSDFFVKNLVAIRAEKREALAVYRPAAFRYGSY